jgi:hypothetical protein
MNSDYKLKYLKYKNKYITLKNELLVGGAPPMSFNNNNETIKKLEDLDSVKEILMKNLFSIGHFDKSRIIKSEKYDGDKLKEKINSFFTSAEYLLLLNSIITKGNMKKNLYDEILKKYKISIEDINKSLNIELKQILQKVSAIDKIQDPTKKEGLQKQINETISKSSKMYNAGTNMITYFNNYFQIFKTKSTDNTIGQKYEDYINNSVIKKISSLDLPLLYLYNVKCVDGGSIFEKGSGDYVEMKGELDGLILVKIDNEYWYPLIILEMKNNINLIMDDLDGVNKLLTEMSKLLGSGKKDLRVGKETYSVDMSGFANINFFYCVNNVFLDESNNYDLLNSNLIRELMNDPTVEYIKGLKNNDKFTSSQELSNYILSVVSSAGNEEIYNSKEEEDLKRKIANASKLLECDNVELTKGNFAELVKKTEGLKINPKISDPRIIVNESTDIAGKIGMDEIKRNIDTNSVKFIEFFANPNNKIIILSSRG